MKIGSLDTPSSRWVTLSAGICRSGRERHLGGLGGTPRGAASAPATTSPTAPLAARPAAASPALRSSCLRVTVLVACVLCIRLGSASGKRTTDVRA